MMNVNVGVFDPCTRSMGPGIRFCLWVKGCTIQCSGCSTSELIPSHPSQLSDVIDVLDQIQKAKNEYKIEGVSFSGGEPFEQAEELAYVAKISHSLGLSTLSWSGYTRHFLESKRAPIGSKQFLQELDVLIDGVFDKRFTKNKLVLRGSTNQKIHRLTDRYSVEDLQTATVSMTLDKNGIQIVGIMDYELGKTILSLIGTI